MIRYMVKYTFGDDTTMRMRNVRISPDFEPRPTVFEDIRRIVAVSETARPQDFTLVNVELLARYAD